MTQNLTPVATDKPDYDKQSSTEIRADIDQTRASVGDKIDQLQARLDPNRLKQQAQETVQEMLNDTASSMTGYVKTHRDEMVTSLADAARRNPLPTALVGLGLGWLILESMAGRRDERPYTGRPLHQGSVGSYSAPQQNYNPTSNWRPAEYSSEQNYTQASGQGFSQGYNPTSGQDFSRGYSQSSGQGYTGQSAGQGYTGQSAGQNYTSQNYGQSYGQSSGQGYNQGYNQESRYQESRYEEQQGYGNGHQQGENPLSKATGVVKDSVSGITDRVGDTMSGAKDMVGGVMSDMTERVSGVVSDVGDRLTGAVGGVRHQANEMRQQGMEQFDRASGQMGDWQQQARYQGKQRSRQVVNNLEDNPLIYGAVALAAGAALALLLPPTRIENRVFGDMRDQVMDKGREAIDTARDHAQQVFEEVRPELEQTARQIVSDVKDTGMQAARDAADQLKPVIDTAVTRSKEEAVSAAKEVGVNPDKLMPSSQSSGGQSSGSQSSGGSSTMQSGMGQSGMGQSSRGQSSSGMTSGSTLTSTPRQGPALNRDTLAGQWKQVKGEAKRKWGQLTDDDLMQIGGDYDKLVGSIQTRYGYTREQIDREIEDFFKNQTV
jgi:uncharacterized protein YjbJ (UPF0337 family)/ElaB/YqjD/DUF883 family membrane-anchored ribosome-binding protein